MSTNKKDEDNSAKEKAHKLLGEAIDRIVEVKKMIRNGEIEDEAAEHNCYPVYGGGHYQDLTYAETNLHNVDCKL